MLQCHECGCDIRPGEAARRDVVLGMSTSHSPQGGRTDIQRGLVSFCPKCVRVIDERAQQASRSSALWITAIFGGFLLLVAGGYFLVVKPGMDEHKRVQKRMEEDFEKSRKEQEDFQKQHFGNQEPPN